MPDDTYQRTQDRLAAEPADMDKRLRVIEEQQRYTAPVQPVAVGLLAEWDTLAVAERRELLRRLLHRVEVIRPARGPVEVRVGPSR